MGFRKDFGPPTAKLFFMTNTEADMARHAGNLYQYFIPRTENAPPQPSSAWTEEEITRIRVNYAFENYEDRNEVIYETSAFELEEIELRKPFLI